MRGLVVALGVVLAGCQFSVESEPPPEKKADPACDGAQFLGACRGAWTGARYGVSLTCQDTPWLTVDGKTSFRPGEREGCFVLDPGRPGSVLCCGD